MLAPHERNFYNAGRLGFATLIADIEGHQIATMYSPNINPTAATDAALFISSPRLLEALISAERFVSGFEGDELQRGIDSLLAQMRAAIALADPPKAKKGGR